MPGITQHSPIHQRTTELGDSGATAFVVIDSHLGGGGTGGIRMGESVTLEEVADLAHEMTLKFAWLNIPRGGAKSGIACKGGMSEENKVRLLQEFGKFVSDLMQSREYVAGVDLGISSAELAIITASAGVQSDTSGKHVEIDSNYFTALTVFVSLMTLLDQAGEELSQLDVLVEGVGKVASHLLQMLASSGARVVGVSTIAGAIFDSGGLDVEKVLRLQQTHGDECVNNYASGSWLARDELFQQCADVLVPGARPYSINESNIELIKAQYIVPIANIPASPAIEEALHARGILYIPGFVSNAGGIFCWYLARLSMEARENFIRERFAGKVRRLLDAASRKNRSISELARAQAKENTERMTLEENGSFLQQLVGDVRKLAPRRFAYAVLCRCFGKQWAHKDSVFCKWYFDAKYLS